MSLSSEDRPHKLMSRNVLADLPVRHDIVPLTDVYNPLDPLSSLHTHEFVEITQVVQGVAIQHILNHTVECHKGDMYIINVDVPHAIYQKPGEAPPLIRNILFDVASLFTGYAVSPWSSRFCYGVFQENPLAVFLHPDEAMQAEIERICALFDAESEKRDAEWKESIRANLTLLLISLRRHTKQDPAMVRPSKIGEHRLVLSVMREATTHYSDPDLTLERLAKSTYCSTSHISRTFFRLSGEHFSDYLRNIRLDHACQFLLTTQMTNEQIAYNCGLRDLSSFYRTFQKRFSMTPSQYRTQHDHSAYGKTLSMKKGVINMSILNEISEQLQKGKAKIVKTLVSQAIDEGISPEQILNEGLLSGMNVIGEKFKNNEVYVPEVLVAARAMNAGSQLLKPLLVAEGVKATGRVCIGTVQGDLHDIGKNLVKMMMEGKGLEVIDLGSDVAPETYVQTAIEQHCQVICCSALLTTTMGVMEKVVQAANAAGIHDRVKIMIGGAPVNDEFCKRIGADVYTADAASAADAAVELCRLYPANA